MMCLALLLIAVQAVEIDVLEIKGTVEHKIPGQKWEPLKQGMKIKRGAMVQTGIKSGALLQFGKSTKVLVRASTFAVINESFAEKNAYTGELRVDVGSIRLEAAPEREEKLNFKVETPQGTAAVRGTVLQLHTDDMGTLAFGEQGLTQFSTPGGWEYELGGLIKDLNTAGAGDLAGMASGEKNPDMANDNLDGKDPGQGEKSWNTDAFNPASDSNALGHQMHPLTQYSLTNVGNLSNLRCAFLRWELLVDLAGSNWTVTPLSPICGAGPFRVGDWLLTVHGRPAWILEDIAPSAPTDWRLRDVNGIKEWAWDPNLVRWIPQ